MKKPSAVVTINGQQVLWSVVSRVRSLCGGDWPRTIDVFWKARHCSNITLYVLKGLVPDKTGHRYSLSASSEYDAPGGKERQSKWWNALPGTQAKAKPEDVKTAIRSSLMEVINSL